MKTNTDHITIGRNPALTIAIVQAIALRKKKRDRWALWKKKLTFWRK